MTLPLISPGETIGVMAPSSAVKRSDIEADLQWLRDQGYRIYEHPQTYEHHHQSAGTAADKAAAFTDLWNNRDIAAIWAARGGNRALHFIDEIDWGNLPKGKGKPVIGFSDATALLNAVYACTGQICFHGPVIKGLAGHQNNRETLSVLAGKHREWTLTDARIVKGGSAEGRLIGGNLSVFQYLPQTLPGEFWRGSVLFLEDCNEETSRLDRMLLHLKRLKILDQAAAVIFGDFSGLKDTGTPYGFTWPDIVHEHCSDLNIPVLMNAGFGHAGRLPCFPLGARARLDGTHKTLRLLQ